MYFYEHLSYNFVQTDSQNAVFLKTAIRFATGYESVDVSWFPDLLAESPWDCGGTSHGCIYYGTSNDGTIYVYTKNGDDFPKIMKLNDLQNQMKDIYGNIIGIDSGSGFYLYNK